MTAHVSLAYVHRVPSLRHHTMSTYRQVVPSDYASGYTGRYTGAVKFLCGLSAYHLVMFVVTCILLFSHHAEDRLTHAPTHFSINGTPAWKGGETETGWHPAAGLAVALACYLVSAWVMLWDPESRNKHTWWPIANSTIIGVGNAAAFVSISAFVGMTDLYEILAASFVKIACGCLSGVLIRDAIRSGSATADEKHPEHMLGMLVSFVSSVVYILAVNNLDGITPFKGYGNNVDTADDAVTAGVWLWIISQFLADFVFILVTGVGPLTKWLRSGAQYSTRKERLESESIETDAWLLASIFAVLYAAGVGISWAGYFSGTKLSANRYAPIYHQTAAHPTVANSDAPPVGLLLPIAWTTAFVLQFAPNILSYMHYDKNNSDLNDTAKNCAVSFSNALVFVLLAIICGIRGLNEVIFLGGLSVVTGITMGYYNKNQGNMYLGLVTFFNMVPWILVAIKLYSGKPDGDVDDLVSGIFWPLFVLVLAGCVIDMLIRGSLRTKSRKDVTGTFNVLWWRHLIMRVIHLAGLALITGLVLANDGALYTKAEARAMIAIVATP